MVNRNRAIKIFFIKGICLLLIVITLDQLVGKLLHTFFKRETTGEYSIANHLVYQLKEDVLILGSSRASHHYNPALIAQSLGLSCYNGGRDGQGILYYAAMFKLSLAQHRPKVLILDMNNRDLNFDARKRDNLSCLLPYLSDSRLIDSFLLKKSPFELLKGQLQTYRYNGQVFSIIQHNLLPGISSGDIAGFKPIIQKMDVSKLNNKVKNAEVEKLDDDYINAFKMIISTCRKNGIKLYVFVSPRYLSAAPMTMSVKKIKAICKDYQVEFNDFTNNVEFTKAAYFADVSHLNVDGANLYTHAVADLIKKEEKVGDQLTFR
ncbi:hypothetical protein [Pedobacter sp. ASV28]|jgi:hypothetical protein|uniref:hypothetical protein n=1 Tax=Pedobacter sp. ASV28 TaxID=2795123 RepID=UPI0018EA5957|nr:hypothetical protein [Pedobacter sp. ASV28]